MENKLLSRKSKNNFYVVVLKIFSTVSFILTFFKRIIFFKKNLFKHHLCRYYHSHEHIKKIYLKKDFNHSHTKKNFQNQTKPNMCFDQQINNRTIGFKV